MKTAISLPDDVFREAERLLRRKHMSRSELYATAIRWYVQKENGAGITDQLNKVYQQKTALDPVVERVGVADLGQEDWS
jgi:metal-responsive CopG/Arc/MetJ family transcriptional regulator